MIETHLNNIHREITANRLLQLFTAMTRLLLAVGFTPPSIVKIINQPFTVLPDSHPVGHYFNALYQTGFYYQFIGWSQLIAAILLIFPRTAHLGALLFLPIILNIVVLTNSVGFQGTWLVTIFMTLAALWLVAWDYDRLRDILFRNRLSRAPSIKREFVLVPAFFAFGGLGLAVFAALVRLGNLADYMKMAGALTAIGLVFGVAVSIHHRFMMTGELVRSKYETDIPREQA